MNLNLHNAIRSCDLEEIRTALENDTSEINLPDPILGWTPLYKAVLYRDYGITKMLLENGADPDLCNQIGESALHMAIENNLEEILTLLIDYRAKLDLCGNDGQTPLHLAVLNKNENILKILIKAGVSINAQNEVGKTALHLALESDNIEYIKVLMENGADLYKADNCGIAPIDMSVSSVIKELINSFPLKNDKILKEKNLNLMKNCNEIQEKEELKPKQLLSYNPEDPKLKENMVENFNEIQEKISILEKNKSEFKEISATIEKTLEEIKNPEIIQKTEETHENTTNLSKKKSMNFEEYREKCANILSEGPSMIKEENSFTDIKIDIPFEIKPSSNFVKKPHYQPEAHYKPEPYELNNNELNAQNNKKSTIYQPNDKETELYQSNIIPNQILLTQPLQKTELNQSKLSNYSQLENQISLSKPIDVWLKEIHLETILQNFLDLGIENNNSLLSLLRQNTQNWDKMLITHFGIDKPGYRKRIITKLKEDMGLCKRSGLFKLKNSNAKLKFLDLTEWLKSLDLEELAQNFMAAGYDDYESLIFQMTTDNTINERILEEDVLIDDPLARMKICNQLMEDALKASEIDAPDNFEGEISFEINERKPGNWKETCVIF